MRDVGEDLDRGRVYLPLDELALFGVTREMLEERVATPAIKQALAFQVERVRELEERSRPGVEMLHPSSRDCIEAARVLYCGIVDEVESRDYEVFATRATVPMRRRLAVAGPAWVRAVRARRRFPDGTAGRRTEPPCRLARILAAPDRRSGDRRAVDSSATPQHPQAQRQQHQREAEEEVLHRGEGEPAVPDERRRAGLGRGSSDDGRTVVPDDAETR